MKISLEWLADYLPGTLTADEAARALTFGGLPVETIDQVGPDTVIDVEVTSNRGDCLSHIGVARELGALLKRESKDVATTATPSQQPAEGAISVRIEAPQLCPQYIARVIRNVKIRPSPQWIVRRLEAIGLRAINNVVDITNYVMMEMGQPLHAFDYDKVGGRQVVVRIARAGEKLTSLDGHERALTPGMLVIADTQRPIALAGVMGGADSEVSESTTNVLLESARFDPLSVRKTARTLSMRSDSSYRFERGIDPTLPERASLRASQLIVELAGGELLSGKVEQRVDSHEPKRLSLRLAQVPRLLGFNIPTNRIVESLTRIGLNPQQAGDRIDVVVPSHRLDITQEIDLVEEVARLNGYDQIPVKEQIEIRTTPADPKLVTADLIRQTLIGAGYFEAVTFSFASDGLAADFQPVEGAALPRADAAVRKADAQLRPSILPGLLESVRHNETVGTTNAKLYEIGSVFWSDAAGKIVEQRKVALVGSDDYREVRGAVEELLNRLDVTRNVKVTPSAHPGFASGAAGEVRWGNQTIGTIGKIAAKVADTLSLRTAPVAAELDLEPLLNGATLVPQLRPLPRFPAIRRDLSLDVADQVAYQQIEQVVRDARPEHLEDVEYVTTYRGKPLDKGTKSVTFTLVFRSPTGTLTSEQVEAAESKVVGDAKTKLNARVRT